MSIVSNYYLAKCCTTAAGTPPASTVETLNLAQLSSTTSATLTSTAEQVSNLTTNDPTYACFVGESLPVYTSTDLPSGEYVVYGPCPDNNTYVTWTFTDPNLKLLPAP